LVVRALGANDVVLADLLLDQPLRIGRDLLVAGDRVRCRKRGNDVGVAPFEIPEVVQVAVGKDDEAAVLGLGVLAGLLFGDERILVLGFGFEDEEREALASSKRKSTNPFVVFSKLSPRASRSVDLIVTLVRGECSRARCHPGRNASQPLPATC